MTSGFLPLVPELINFDDDVLKTKCAPPEDCFDLLLITQVGCGACQRVAETLKSMQNDPNIYFPVVVWYNSTQPRSDDDVNHNRLMKRLDVIDVPALYLINRKQRIIPFPLVKVDGTRVRHVANLSKDDIYRTCMLPTSQTTSM